MLPDITTEELHELADDTKGAVHALDKFREYFNRRAHAHQSYTRAYQVTYHLFGGIAVVVAVVIGNVNGCTHPDTVLALGMTVAILTTILNFFGIESRMQRHGTAKRQYELLSMDIEKWMLTSKREDPEMLERACFDKLRIITSEEPDLSICCIK